MLSHLLLEVSHLPGLALGSGLPLHIQDGALNMCAGYLRLVKIQAMRRVR